MEINEHNRSTTEIAADYIDDAFDDLFYADDPSRLSPEQEIAVREEVWTTLERRFDAGRITRARLIEIMDAVVSILAKRAA